MELLEGKMEGKPGPKTVSTKLQRIAELAKQAPQMAFTGLSHHIDVEFLREAYRRTRKGGATGVDDLSAAEYASNLEVNLLSLLDRFKSGNYRAPPVRRVHLPKGDGKTRPIGIPTFEDKVLQRAVHMVVEAVYEQDFLGCSYGFRPGRSAHQALDTLWKGLMAMDGGWVLEVDIQGFFDTVDHGHLRSFLDRRIRDGVIRRSIGKWLKAGVLEAGELHHPDEGTPQGGVIAPPTQWTTSTGARLSRVPISVGARLMDGGSDERPAEWNSGHAFSTLSSWSRWPVGHSRFGHASSRPVWDASSSGWRTRWQCQSVGHEFGDRQRLRKSWSCDLARERRLEGGSALCTRVVGAAGTAGDRREPDRHAQGARRG